MPSGLALLVYGTHPARRDSGARIIARAVVAADAGTARQAIAVAGLSKARASALEIDRSILTPGPHSLH